MIEGALDVHLLDPLEGPPDDGARKRVGPDVVRNTGPEWRRTPRRSMNRPFEELLEECGELARLVFVADFTVSICHAVPRFRSRGLHPTGTPPSVPTLAAHG